MGKPNSIPPCQDRPDTPPWNTHIDDTTDLTGHRLPASTSVMMIRQPQKTCGLIIAPSDPGVSLHVNHPAAELSGALLTSQRPATPNVPSNTHPDPMPETYTVKICQCDSRRTRVMSAESTPPRLQVALDSAISGKHHNPSGCQLAFSDGCSNSFRMLPAMTARMKFV